MSEGLLWQRIPEEEVVCQARGFPAKNRARSARKPNQRPPAKAVEGFLSLLFCLIDRHLFLHLLLAVYSAGTCFSGPWGERGQGSEVRAAWVAMPSVPGQDASARASLIPAG